ncbi:MAG: D-inositol 3-phosphate glycosyltransferase [Candidatus Hydrogenedentota bacterium]|jgi:glycosyltransferase involved in cell wall biosynthesis
MRIAFVDHVFTWPPLGGAPADLYYTMQGIAALGHEVHLFYGQVKNNWALPPVQRDALPFKSTAIEYEHDEIVPEFAMRKYREAVDTYRPDLVFQCFTFLMKPYLSKALSHYPQVSRYYAYEPFCLRDYRLWRDFHTCPYNFLTTPNVCRKCTFNRLWRQLRTGRPDAYAFEYQVTGAHAEPYHALLHKTLADYKAVIVYNHFTKRLLGDINPNVHVIGGGVRLEDYPYVPLEPKEAGKRAIILMTGRAEDISKGTMNLWKAGEILARTRDDFQIWITDTNQRHDTEWFKAIGWHPIAKVKEFYQQADICAVPSTWEEPFGLVAIEAMATGRPCVVADVGGLQDIVVEGETGHIFDRDSPEALAAALAKLLDDPAARRRMGDAGRRRVEENYTWEHVVQSNYPRIIEEALR